MNQRLFKNLHFTVRIKWEFTIRDNNKNQPYKIAFYLFINITNTAYFQQ